MSEEDIAAAFERFKVLADRNKIRRGRLVEELLKEAGGLEARP